MQLPPEVAYGQVNGGSGWIKDDFEKYKAEQLSDYVAEYGAENILIKSDYYTLTTDKPSYAVFVRPKDGIGAPIPVTTANNVKRRWYPDIQQNTEYKENRQAAIYEQQKVTSSAAYRQEVFNEAFAGLAALEGLDAGTTSPAGWQADMMRIQNKSAAIAASVFEGLAVPMSSEGVKRAGRGAVSTGKKVDKELDAKRVEAFNDAYQRKLKEIEARLRKRYEEKYPQKPVSAGAPVRKRGANPKTYVPKI
jgi:hypothetical protein